MSISFHLQNIKRMEGLNGNGDGKGAAAAVRHKATPVPTFRKTLLHSTPQNTAKFALRSPYFQEWSNVQGEIALPLVSILPWPIWLHSKCGGMFMSARWVP